jgi:hypothetical protein
MATIKLTGLGSAFGITTAGTDDISSTPGGLTVGDADTDDITINAEFTSSLIPDIDNAVDLGNGDKSWREICLGTAINLHGTGNLGLRLVWEDPTIQDETITLPARSGHVALEGFLPSYLSFGKNNAQSADLTDFELSTVNGSTNARGWRMPVPGAVTHISCQYDATASGGTNSFTLDLYKNGVKEVGYSLVMNDVTSGDQGDQVAFSPHLPFSAGDSLTLKLTMTAGQGDTFTMDDLACLLRVLN